MKVLNTQAGTITLHCCTCWASRTFRGQTSKFVPEMRTSTVRAPFHGSRSTFEVAGAGNTLKDGNFQTPKTLKP